MLVADFKKLVLDYMNRDGVLFDSNSTTQVDKLLNAINNAKLQAQRKQLFELARDRVTVVINKTSGGNITTAVDALSVPVRVRAVERAFLPSSDNQSLIPVDYVGRDAQVRYVKRRVENVYDATDKTLPPATIRNPQIVRHANRLEVYPWDSNVYTALNVTATFDVVAWMPPYGLDLSGTTSSTVASKLVDATANFTGFTSVVGQIVRNLTDGTSALVSAVESATTLLLNADIFTTGESYKVGTGTQEDFFLVDCLDWMLYQTVKELNLFLKEDQRVAISDAMMKEAWESVKAWNSSLVPTTDDLDLD